MGERATRGLIAYLAIKRVPATMDELTEALWPGENPVKTRQRLWKAKRQAQRQLGGALVREQDSYALDRTRLHIDADELERLRATASPGMEELERAVALTREEPLADVDYPWADGERRRLQAIQAELLERIAKVRLERLDGNGALVAAERLIQLDALNERGWCLAMEAEGALGNRQAILVRYEQLARQLDERLGLRPGPRDEGDLSPAARSGMSVPAARIGLRKHGGILSRMGLGAAAVARRGVCGCRRRRGGAGAGHGCEVTSLQLAR